MFEIITILNKSVFKPSNLRMNCLWQQVALIEKQKYPIYQSMQSTAQFSISDTHLWKLNKLLTVYTAFQKPFWL